MYIHTFVEDKEQQHPLFPTKLIKSHFVPILQITYEFVKKTIRSHTSLPPPPFCTPLR